MVPDEGAVAEFAADGTNPSFRVGVRDGRVGRGADDGGIVAAEDLIERLGEIGRRRRGSRTGLSGRRIMKLRAAWVVQSPLGLVVMPGEVHAASAELDEEQHVVAPQRRRCPC